MALLRKRYASFDREDKTFGIRALIMGDSWAIRIAVFVILSGLFILIVQLTHRRVTSHDLKLEQVIPDSTNKK
jgi:membrane protein implicated in regulation of membrane protease activity